MRYVTKSGPLVPWAVGHVGHREGAAEKVDRCGLCGTHGQNLWGMSVGGVSVCTPCWKQANDALPKPMQPVAKPLMLATCTNCGAKESDNTGVFGWSSVRITYSGGVLGSYCTRPGCRSIAEFTATNKPYAELIRH